MKGPLLAASAALLWGSVPVASKIVLQEISPLLLAFMRLSLAAIFLLAFRKIVAQRFKRPAKQEWPLLAIGGIGLACNYAFYNLGLNLTTAISAQLVVQSATIFLVIASVIFLDEEVTRRKAIATITALIGVFIVVWNGHDLSVLLGMRSLFGDLLIIIAAFSWTIFTLMQRILHDRYGAYQLVTYMFIISSIAIAPFSILEIHQLLAASSQVLVLLLYLALIGTGLSYLLFASSLKYSPVSLVAVIILIGPLVTVVLAKIFLAEQITGYAIFGGGILLASLYFVAR